MEPKYKFYLNLLIRFDQVSIQKCPLGLGTRRGTENNVSDDSLGGGGGADMKHQVCYVMLICTPAPGLHRERGDGGEREEPWQPVASTDVARLPSLSSSTYPGSTS